MLIVVFSCSSRGYSKGGEELFDGSCLPRCLSELFTKKKFLKELVSTSFKGDSAGRVSSSAIPDAEANKKQHPNNRIFLFIFLGTRNQTKV